MNNNTYILTKGCSISVWKEDWDDAYTALKRFLRSQDFLDYTDASLFSKIENNHIAQIALHPLYQILVDVLGGENIMCECVNGSGGRIEISNLYPFTQDFYPFLVGLFSSIAQWVISGSEAVFMEERDGMYWRLFFADGGMYRQDSVVQWNLCAVKSGSSDMVSIKSLPVTQLPRTARFVCKMSRDDAYTQALDALNQLTGSILAARNNLVMDIPAVEMPEKVPEVLSETALTELPEATPTVVKEAPARNTKKTSKKKKKSKKSADILYNLKRTHEPDRLTLSRLIRSAIGDRSVASFARDCGVAAGTLYSVLKHNSDYSCSMRLLASIAQNACPGSNATVEALAQAGGYTLYPNGAQRIAYE